MSITTFAQFRETHHEILTIKKEDDETYQRLTCSIRDLKGPTYYGHVIINTTNGELFTANTKKGLFGKRVGLLLAHPVIFTIKTLWHASIIGPLANETILLVKGEQNFAKFKTHTVNSLKDIVRTPLYGITITVGNFFSLILAGFSPNSLYKTGDLLGKMHMRLVRGNQGMYTCWILGMCLWPIDNIFREPQISKGALRGRLTTLAYRLFIQEENAKQMTTPKWVQRTFFGCLRSHSKRHHHPECSHHKSQKHVSTNQSGEPAHFH